MVNSAPEDLIEVPTNEIQLQTLSSSSNDADVK